jgi:Ni,Fe-hydrogenase I small subunit
MMKSNITRRGFIEHCAAVSATTALSAWTASSVADELPKADWLQHVPLVCFRNSD